MYLVCILTGIRRNEACIENIAVLPVRLGYFMGLLPGSLKCAGNSETSRLSRHSGEKSLSYRIMMHELTLMFH